MLGSVADYLEIEIPSSSLRVFVPAQAADRVGLRCVIGRRQLRGVLDVLGAEPEGREQGWSERVKRHRAMLASGDIREVAAVVRNLAARAATASLPVSERELYRRSRRLLVSEIGYALCVEESRAEAYLDAALPPGECCA